LREALKDSDSDVQMWAALTLINNQAYDKASVPICIRVLSNTNSMLRQVACLSLGLMPHDDSDKKLVLPALAQTAQNDADPEVRQAALSALGVISPESISAAR
jgi:HEAT repeat protein